ADNRGITAGVGAQLTQIALREVKALPARAYLFLDRAQRLRKRQGFPAIGGKQIMGQPLRCFRPDARQISQFLDQTGNRPGRLHFQGPTPESSKYIADNAGGTPLYLVPPCHVALTAIPECSSRGAGQGCWPFCLSPRPRVDAPFEGPG